MFVIVTKICPLDSINEALHYFMKISHEMSVGLKKIKKKKNFYRRVKYIYPKDVPFKKILNTYCIAREAD